MKFFQTGSSFESYFWSVSIVFGVALFSSLVGSSVSAHQADQWEDRDVGGESHKIHVRHYKNQAEAIAACIIGAEVRGYTPGSNYCRNYSGSLGEQYIIAGWFRTPGTSNFTYFHYYYEQYFLEFHKPKVCNAATAANPCEIATGNKVQAEVDYIAPGEFPIEFKRYYSSIGSNGTDPTLGIRWRHSYSKSVNKEPGFSGFVKRPGQDTSTYYGTEQQACLDGWALKKPTIYGGSLTNAVAVYTGQNQCNIILNGKKTISLRIHSTKYNQEYLRRPDTATVTNTSGQQQHFTLIAKQWVHDNNSKLKLSETQGDWTYTTSSGVQEIFDTNGDLKRRINRRGVYQDFVFNLAVASGGDGDDSTLDKIIHQLGYEVSFSYDGQKRISQLQTPRGLITYNYDVNGNLSQITREDNTIREYVYENTALPNHLTGIIDENGDRFATWTYDDRGGNMISSEHAGGVEKTTFNLFSAQAHVKHVLGSSNYYKFDWVNGAKKLKSIIGKRCVNCNHGDTKSKTYDDTGRVETITDWNNVVTRYIYTNGFRTRVIEAEGTPEEKITNTVWDLQLNLPLERLSATEKVKFVYDAQGILLSTTTTDLVTLEQRTITHTYDQNKRLTMVNNARTDVSDLTNYQYYPNGRLEKTINALGHETVISEYNLAGYPATIVHPNGAVESLTYSSRGWVATRTLHGAQTSYTYDGVGQLIRIDLPNGTNQQYEYDAAHRLVAVIDTLGNRTEYTLDLASNITKVEKRDRLGAVVQSNSRTYDNINQLTQSVSGQLVQNDFVYDTRGNLTKSTNGLGNSTTSTLDSLSRLVETVDPLLGKTSFGYDPRGNLTSVTDAEGKTTSYEYNAFGDLIQLTSPDTGITTFTYDKASNPLTKTDARGVTVIYTYDALNRVLSQSYSDNAENIIYTYDDTTNSNKGIGRLTSVTDQTGSTSYVYNAFGQIIKETKVINGQTYLIEYQFDPNGQLTGMIYPSGRVINYSFDGLARVDGLTSTYQNQVKTLASSITYLPFGPMTGLTYGNGKTLTQSYDLDYRLTDKTTSSIHQMVYGYDLTNNITGISGTLDVNNTQIFSYDKLSRLLTSNGEYGSLTFTYDKVGNRLSKTDNNAVDAYTYAVNTHRLASITGANSTSFTHDAIGNTLTKNGLTFSYNQQGRLSTASKVGMHAAYLYNFKGQRSSKQMAGGTTQFIYDLNGQLIAKADSNGVIQKEYIYLNGQWLASIDGSTLYYMHTDHLGMPVALTDEAGVVQWKAHYTPFGKEIIEVNNLTQNIRFPGQYYDEETGLHYNYFRYYDPNTGRYITSDPIGLEGGLNTYAYVRGNPINWFDSLGLYGTQNCSYYDQACSANQGSYECNVASNVCPKFPDNDGPSENHPNIANWSECVRQCLQERHNSRMPNPQQCSPDNNISLDDNVDDHVDCFSGCKANPNNPYNPSGPYLPNSSPNLFGR